MRFSNITPPPDDWTRSRTGGIAQAEGDLQVARAILAPLNPNADNITRLGNADLPGDPGAPARAVISRSRSTG